MDIFFVCCWRPNYTLHQVSKRDEHILQNSVFKKEQISQILLLLQSPTINVLQIIDKSFPGGGQKHVCWLSRELSRYPFLRVMIATSPGGEMWKEFQKVAERVFPTAMSSLVSPLALVRLINILSKNEIHVVHTHGGVAGLWGRIAAWLTGIPVVVHTLHGVHYVHYQNPITRGMGIFLERLLSKITFKIIFVSDSNKQLADRLRLVPPEKAIVIKNAVEIPPSINGVSNIPSDFLSYIEKKGTDKIYIGCIARFDPVKGHEFLIKAFSQLTPRYPQIELFLVGDGKEEEHIRALTKKLGLMERVHFLGYQQNIYPILGTMDIIVQPSLWEGLSLTLLEAMGMGRAIVATETEGNTDLLEDGKTALLVPPKDIEALAQAMEKLVVSQEMRQQIGNAAREYFRATNNLADMSKKVLNLYLEGLEELAKS
ncbi:MAG: glycosyltransferase family 1 protein [Calditrichaeota bacterium]|nr:MAG: glycosyltransferase family 1 protein [Calditrichota bacterium]